jgi:hypothetical protein
MQHIWIFQLAVAPSEATKALVLQQLDAFTAVWKAHGAPVPGKAEMRHDRFVVVVAEPGHATGCSIDSMTKGVTDILAHQNLEILGPERIFFKGAGGQLDHIDFKEVRAAILDGRLSPATTVFDSTMGQTNDLSRWELPLDQTWMGRFLPQKA